MFEIEYGKPVEGLYGSLAENVRKTLRQMKPGASVVVEGNPSASAAQTFRVESRAMGKTVVCRSIEGGKTRVTMVEG